MAQEPKKQVVTMGGGHGSYILLSGLKKYQSKIDIQSVISIADDGGSTGRLREQFGYLPLGDLRMALVALAGDDAQFPLLDLLRYRFAKGDEGLKGHNLGNLILTALTDMLGSEVAAIREVSKMLHLEGLVLPASEKHTTLTAYYSDGSLVRGQHFINNQPHNENVCITKLVIDPIVPAYPRVLDAIQNAELVVLGPGDLFTSIIPNILIPEIGEALRKTPAKLVYVANLMTRCGQTYGMTVTDHTKTLEEYVGRSMDTVLINTESIPDDIKSKCELDYEFPVVDDYQRECIRESMLYKAPPQDPSDVVHRSLVLHNADTLGESIMKLL